MSKDAAPPGWYPDPGAPGAWRYRDGREWTGRRSDALRDSSTPTPSRRAKPLWSRLLLVTAMILGALTTASVAFTAFVSFAYFLTPPEPVDWSTQPVEVRAGDPYAGCELTFDAVAPGTHEIRVFAVRPHVRVVVKDSSGRVILRAAEEADGYWTEVPTVRLALGTYRVECRAGDGTTGSTKLRVIPAGQLGLG